jgi:thiol-disulfide isomerase/thioredoxin
VNHLRTSPGRCALSIALAASCLALAACGGSSPKSATDNGNGFVLNQEPKRTTPTGGATTIDPGATSTTVDPKLANQVQVGPNDATSDPFRFLALNLYTGAAVDGEQLYAKAPLVTVFVTPWCPVCIQEGPMLAGEIKQHPEITFLFVHASASPEEYKLYVDNAGLDGPNVVHVDDTEGALWRRFNVASQPSFVFVDAKGHLRASTGALDEAGLKKATGLVVKGLV